MTARRFTSAIIGAGRIAGFQSEVCNGPQDVHSHIQAQHLLGINLSSVWDVDISKAQDFCGRWGATAYDSLTSLLDDGPYDVISICTPDDTHYEMLNIIWQHPHRPRLIIVEKPLCTSQEELMRIGCLLAQGDGPAIAVNVSRRFSESYRILRDWIQARKLGEPRRTRHIYYGGWMHNGIHLLDTLYFLFPDLVLQPLWKRYETFGTLNDACLEGCFDMGGGHHLDLCAVDEKDYQCFELDILFSKGRLRLMDFGQEVYLDKPVQNSLGEVELKADQKLELAQGGSPMYGLYEASLEFLSGESRRILDLAGLPSVRQSFDTLFKLKEPDHV